MIEEPITNEVVFQKLRSMQSYVNDFHFHNFYEIFFLIRGELNFYIQDSCYQITAGSLLLINDMEIHKTINVTDNLYERIYIHIPQNFFTRYSSSNLDLKNCFTNRPAGEKNLILLNSQQQDYMLQQYEQLESAKKLIYPGDDLLMDTHLLQILIFINNIFEKQIPAIANNYSPVIRNIINYLNDNLLETITLDGLAEHFLLSKYHLCHIFKSETGTTIQSYLLLCRIACAKKLLAKGCNVTEACYQSGFKDYSNFITSFKKITGLTPKKYSSLSR